MIPYYWLFSSSADVISIVYSNTKYLGEGSKNMAYKATPSTLTTHYLINKISHPGLYHLFISTSDFTFVAFCSTPAT
jgi:hypothetical protein